MLDTFILYAPQDIFNIISLEPGIICDVVEIVFAEY